MHSVPEIEWSQWSTGRPVSSDLRDALWCGEHVRCEVHKQARLEPECRSTWRWSIWKQPKGGTPGAETLVIWLVNSQLCECDEVTLPLNLSWRTGLWWSICSEASQKLQLHSVVNLRLSDWREARQYLLDALLGVCFAQCMLYFVYTFLGGMLNLVYAWTRHILYLVYAVLCVNSWSWHGEIERADKTLYTAMTPELWMRKRDGGWW